MLKQRIITAVILALALFAAIFYASDGVFALITGIVMLGAAWEWSKLAGLSQALRGAFVAVTAGVLYLVFRLEPGQQEVILLMSGIWWLCAAVAVLSFPRGAGVWSGTAQLSLIGLLVMAAGWLAMNLLRQWGVVYLIWILLITWGADVGAYFAGRAWGNSKLAPAVSPGKTWAGFWGGMATSLAVTLAVMPWLEQAYTLSNLLLYVAVTVLLVICSVLGDLAESMMKRQRGIKDSGSLLPGHGGVMDRVDSLVATLPVFALLVIWVGI